MRPLSRWLSSCGSLLALAALFLVVPSPAATGSAGRRRSAISRTWPSAACWCCSCIDAPVVRAPGHAALVPVPDRQCRTGRRGRAHAGTFRPQVPAGSAVRQQLHPGRRPRPPATGARPRRRDIALRAALAPPRSAPAALCLRAAGGVPGGACRPAIPASERCRPVAAVQPAAQVAGQRAQQWPTGGRRLARRRPSGHPAGRRRAQPTRPFRNAAAGRRRARAQRPDRGHGGNPRRIYRRQPRRHQQQLPRSADAQAEWLGRTGDDHPGLRAAQPPDHPRPLRHALRRLQQARLGHAEGRRAAEQPGPGQGVPARPAAPARFQHALPAGCRPALHGQDKVMPQMGFDKTLGRDWFRNTSYLEFPGAWTTRPSSRAPRPT